VRSRVIMEKPFGTDYASAVSLNAQLHEVFDEEQIFRIDHFLGKEAAQNILAFRFANGLFEPIWHRNNISHIEIDVPETLGLTQRGDFYEATGAYRDMVVTHLFQILAFTAMEPPTALEPSAISREKNKVFRSMQPIQPTDVVRGQYTGYHDEPGVKPDSETETFVALKCFIDNWRWAGVPFYLRTGKRMAEGARIISIAFKEPPQSMFPPGSGVGDHGPDHLTFDLADQPSMSLSFYGKRPGPGFRLDKLSMQFSMQETSWAGAVLEAYERLIYDAATRRPNPVHLRRMGIERLWEISQPCSTTPPCGPTRKALGAQPDPPAHLAVHISWRLPFERAWRVGVLRVQGQPPGVDVPVATGQCDGHGAGEVVGRQLEVACQQVAGPSGEQPHRHAGADHLLGDRAHGAVATEGTDDVDLLLEGLSGLSEAHVVFGGGEEQRLGPPLVSTHPGDGRLLRGPVPVELRGVEHHGQTLLRRGGRLLLTAEAVSGRSARRGPRVAA
jgi:glucose-6-phosphate 1-dehydrogenase